VSRAIPPAGSFVAKLKRGVVRKLKMFVRFQFNSEGRARSR